MTPIDRPTPQILGRIIEWCAQLYDERAIDVTLGKPDLRSRHLAYWVIRRLYPRLTRSVVGKLVSAPDVYVQARAAEHFVLTHGKPVRAMVDAIASAIRPRPGLYRSTIPAASAPVEKAQRLVKADEPSIADLCRGLSALRISAGTAAAESADRLIDFHAGDRCIGRDMAHVERRAAGLARSPA